MNNFLKINNLTKRYEKNKSLKVVNNINFKFEAGRVYSIIGPSGSGKSTLMRCLSGSDVFIEDQLFATLDTTIRKIKLDKNHTALLSDTVGFVRKLPHHLVASFKSTLQEVVFADLILIVLDASSKAINDHYKTISKVLDDIQASENHIIVLNHHCFSNFGLFFFSFMQRFFCAVWMPCVP